MIDIQTDSASGIAKTPTNADSNTTSGSRTEVAPRPGDRNLVDAVWLILSPLCLQALSLPATAYIIHHLGPLQYGQWATAAALVAAVAFLSNLGLRTLFVRSVARNPDRSEELLAVQLGLRASLGLLSAGVALLLCWCLGYPHTVFYCVALACCGAVVTAIASVLGDLLQAFQRNRAFAKVSFVAGITLTTCSLVVAYSELGPIGLSAAYLAGPCTSLALSWVLIRRSHVHVRFSRNTVEYRSVLQQSRTIGTQQVVGALRDQIDQLLVPKLVGVTSFGFFTAGSLLASRLTFMPENLSSAFYAEMSRQHAIDKDAATHLVKRLAMLSFSLCMPLAVLLVFLAHPVSVILFPRHAERCIIIMRITAWAIPLAGIWSTARYALQAAGRYNEAAVNDMRSSVLSLAASFFLISQFGIIGACISFLVRPLVSSCFLLPVFVATFPEATRAIPAGRIALSAALMGFLLWLIARMPLSSWVEIVVGSVLASISYILALVCLGVFGASDLSSIFRGRGRRAVA